MYTINQKEQKVKARYRKIGGSSFLISLFVAYSTMGVDNFLKRMLGIAETPIYLWLLFIMFCIILPKPHETIHRIIIKSGKESGKVEQFRTYVIFDGSLSKLRYLCQIIAPFIWISGTIFILAHIIPSFAGILASLLFAYHTATCSSDFYSFYITLKRWKQINYITEDKDHVYFHEKNDITLKVVV